MLKSEPIEFFLRAIPEGFLYILGVYIFSKIKIDRNKYIKSSLITSIVVYCIRLLPIDYGVHTILTILFIIFFSMSYNKIDQIKVIRATITTFIIQFLSEGINMIILNFIPNLNVDNLFNDAIMKTFLGIPSLIITLIILILFYNSCKKKDEIKDV